MRQQKAALHYVVWRHLSSKCVPQNEANHIFIKRFLLPHVHRGVSLRESSVPPACLREAFGSITERVQLSSSQTRSFTLQIEATLTLPLTTQLKTKR